jgi:hypothetical protein
MTEAKDVATALVKSELWPGANPNTILMLCYLAEAEGHHPAVVYRDYHIMQGKPSKKAEAILRDFSAAGGRVEWHALDDTQADATFHHPSGTVRIEWTMERASKAGLNTAMWKKYPRQMLRSRCISEGVRSVCPAATSGLYEENEVADIVAQDAPKAITHQPVEPGADEAPPSSKRAPAWDTPIKGKSALHKALMAIQRELAGCGDSDMIYALTATQEWRDFVTTAEQHAPHYLRGGEPAPEEFEGILNTAERMVAEFDAAEANHMVGLANA